nr:ester cyclase [Chloroflexota bacterium]
LAVLPALGLLFFTANEQRDQAVASARADTSRLVRLAAADQGRLIDSTRQLLTVLALLPEVRGGDPQTCGALLADLLTQYPLYANLGVIQPDGEISCSALPLDDPVNLADRTYLQRALESRDFAMGDYQIGRVTERATLNFAYPVIGADNTVREVIYAALDLAALNRFAAEADLPDEATLTVFDSEGTVLIRYPDPEEWIGRSIAGTPVVTTIVREASGVTEAPGENGEPHLYAYAPLVGAESSGGAYMSIALPREEVVTAANQAFERNVQRLGLVGMLALVAAWVGGDIFGRRDTEARKTLVRQIYAAFSTGSVDELDEAVAPDYRDRSPAPNQSPGLEGLKEVVGAFRAAFPDGQLTPDEMIAEGDTVIARVTLSGTHTAPFFGVQPSGQPVSAEGVETFRIAGGRIVESWSLFGSLVSLTPGITPVTPQPPTPAPGTTPAPG